MRVKPRTIPVIVFSSLIISSVLALTIFGFYAYLEWKEKNMQRSYRLALYDLNAHLFGKYISINLRAKIDKKDVFKGKPIIVGTIKNASNKKIYSLKLKVAFQDSQGQVVYVDTFYPIGFDYESPVHISDITKKTKNFLLEGDSISFTYRLRNCPPIVMDYLKSRLKLINRERVEPLKLTHKIEGLDIR